MAKEPEVRKLEDWELDGTEIDADNIEPTISTLSNPNIKGITITELISILDSFNNPTLKVEISTDIALTHVPISLVVNDKQCCGLIYFGFNYLHGEKIPDFINRGKKVFGLTKELKTFEDKLDEKVKVCTDGDWNFQLINKVVKKDDMCILTYDPGLEQE